MATVSLCMIVKNEEEVLARCLESAKDVVDEIVIVDTGSTDKTKEIALRYTPNVFDFEWIDNFGAARNFAFSKGTKEYLMWLDADDVLLSADAAKIKALVKNLDPSVDTIMLNYNIAFDEQGKPTFSYFRERIVRRCSFAKWEGAIHEVITPFGKIIHNDAGVTHKRKGKSDPLRNLNLFESMLKRGQVLSPREQFYYARELYYNAHYARAIERFTAFLDEDKGWIENNIEACRVLAQCYNAINQFDEARNALLRSFKYDAPRAEVCCEMGAYYYTKNEYKRAAFWYKAALLCEQDETSGAFRLIDCYGFLPNIQLCLCYDRLGRYDEAEQCNEAAGKCRPKAASYLHNKAYFAGRRASEAEEKQPEKIPFGMK